MGNFIYDAAGYWQKPGAGLPGGAANPINWPGQALGQVRGGVENGNWGQAAMGAANFAGSAALAAKPLATGLRALTAPVATRQALQMPRPTTAIVQQQERDLGHKAVQALQNGYSQFQHMQPGVASTMAANRAQSAANLSKLPQSSQQVLNPTAPVGLR